ncbi:MAG: hypothetical protein COW03_11920 [Cytophagales bacterium CG12_big_fil_rev_8_21_14_0_65_40_12]|nr:MAG: hypothetical protein COW03_11920 [Cytophagales bacterium CG12_big_fil_rev_8_21_14_0_65_40_12]PIW05006.1 MAG: hypothetical protein COW40_07015 [Cytophagales bacterium CG17_big_fil_post_rev_8_21_14_2_50_40_13]
MKLSRKISIAIVLVLVLAVIFKVSRQSSVFIVQENKVQLSAFDLPSNQELKEENELENPLKRLQYEYQMLADPKSGEIPKGIHLKELAFAEKMNQQNPLQIRMSANDVNASEASNASGFVSRGPFNIGGRTRGLAIDVANENIIVAGGVSGGIWRSTNGGTSWTRTSSVTQLPAVSTLVQDKRAGQTSNWFYAAGEFFGNSASVSGGFYFGDGIYRSTDNGVTWALIPTTAQGDNVSLGDFGIVNELVIDNSNTTQREMYAATLSQIIRSTDDFQTFSVVLGANNTGFGATDVAISSTGVLIATIANNVNNGANAQEGIYKSTDGITWVNINPPTGLSSSYSRIEIGFDPQNEDVFYAAGPSFLLKHTLSTGAWTTLTSNLNVSTDSGQGHNAQGGYNLLTKVHPASSSTVFVGGTNLLRSTDGFTTSSGRVNIGGYREDNNSNQFPAYNNHHPDQHALTFYPSTPNRMLSGTDGGVHRTQNNLTTGTSSPVVWESLNNGYLTTQFYAIDYYPHHRGDPLLIGGMQDNGTWGSQSNAANEVWVELFGGDGSYNAITYNSIYVSAQEGQMRRFTLNEAGTTYEFQGDISPSSDDAEFLFINSFIYDPVNQDRLYVAAKGKVYYTNDIRTNPNSGDWNEISLGTETNFVSALGASTQPEGVLYIGTQNGKVFKVNDINALAQATEITGGNLPSGTITSIAVDPRNADKVYLTYGNYGLISVWASENGGQTWTSISGNLEENSNGSGSGPSVRYISILPNGENASIYFVGTSLGLFKTETLNGNSTVWAQEGESVIGKSIVNMVKVRPVSGDVVAATHGNGVFQANYDITFSPAINYSIDLVAQRALLRGPVSFVSGQGFAFQWIKDGEDIQGANNSEFTATTPGAYRLRVSDQLGPVALTNIINIALDKTAPVLTSIVRLNPTAEQVEVSEVTFRLTFDEVVEGVATTSFETSGTASGTVSAIAASVGNTVFDVTVNNIQGVGTLGLSVKTDSGITDQFQNAFAGTVQSSETYTIVDSTPPTAVISRSNPVAEATNKTTVIFLVEFNEAVQNVDLADFALSSSSIAANVSNVNTVSALKYEVSVTGYTGEGLVNLDFASSQNITDESGNAFAGNVTSEETYTITSAVSPTLSVKRNFPLVERVNRADVIFELTFSEAVEGVDVADFKLATGSVAGTIAQVSGQSSAIYLVTVNGISEEGTIELDISAANNIVTTGGNSYNGEIASEETFTIDFTVGPTVAIARSVPTDEVTNQAEVTFSVTFSSAVQNVDLSDFELSSSSVLATLSAINAVSATNYLVNVIEIDDDGLIDLNIKATNNIEDADGNIFKGAISSEQTFTILDLITGIDDPYFRDLSIVVRKNPSEGIFEISLSKAVPQGFEYQVINGLGESTLVGSKQQYDVNDVLRIDLSNAANGVYIFKLALAGGFISTKLLKQGN